MTNACYDSIRESLRSHFNHFPQFIAVFSACLLCMSYGMQAVWPSPALPKLRGNITTEDLPFPPITGSQCSLLITLPMAGTLLATPFTIHFEKTISRKYLMILSSVMIIISWVLIAIANRIEVMYVSRVITGIADSFCFTMVPMYNGEVTQPNLRGSLSIYMPLLLTVGMVTTYTAGYALTIRQYAWAAIIIPALHIILFGFMPKSPYYLFIKNNEVKAKKSLQWLRRKQDVDEELEIIKKKVNHDMSEERKFKYIFTKKENRKAVLIIMSLTCIQQMSGSMAIANYLHMIFIESGSNLSALWSATIIGIIQVCTFFVPSILVDRMGRRPLLLISCTGCAISLFCEGLYFFLKKSDHNVDAIYWLPVSALICYNLFYSVGLGVIPYVLLGEYFRTNVKSYGICMSNITFALVASITSKLFQLIDDNFDNRIYISFWIFSISASIGVPFVTMFVPETKNKTLADIQQIFIGKKYRKSYGTNSDSMTKAES